MLPRAGAGHLNHQLARAPASCAPAISGPRVAAATCSAGAPVRALARLQAIVWVYQPASRFWALQALESAGLLVIAVAFALATIWIISRREI